MPDTTRPRSRWPGTLVWLAVLLSLYLTRGVLLLLVVPRSKKQYDDFNLQLPWMSKVLVQWSDWWCKYWYFASPLSLMLLAGGVIAGRHLFRRTWPGNVYATVWLFALVVWFGFATVALSLPQLKLMEGVSK
jgi:type II secretory pathway component PulF